MSTPSTAVAQVPSGFTAAVSGRRMPIFDGIRCVGAISVLAIHSGYPAWFDGVSAFFVLSGFLITTLLLREWRASGTVSLRAFYARRTLRIFPAYYVCVIASFTIDYVAGNGWPPALTRSAFTYTVNYYNAFHGHPSTSIAHLWSLGVEEQFYLLWPVLLLLFARGGLRGIRIGLSAIIVGSVAWRILLHYQMHVGDAYLYNAFDARFDSLAIGCLLATLVGDTRLSAAARALGYHAALPLITIAASVLVLTLPSASRHVYGFTLYAVLMAVLMVQLMELHSSRAWRWLDARPVVFLGTISYSTYLFHQWGLGLGHWVPTESRVVQLVVGALITYAAATISYFVIEKPFLLAKRRFSPEITDRKERSGDGALVAACVRSTGQPVS